MTKEQLKLSDVVMDGKLMKMAETGLPNMRRRVEDFFKKREMADKRRSEELTRVKQKSLLNSSLSEAAQAIDELSN